MTPPLQEEVRALLPALFADGPISVARVETTRPVFLLFASDSTKPACVVQIGPRRDMEQMRETLTTLHERVGDLVPGSLACAPWRDGQYLHIQQGLAGLPWFQIGEVIQRKSEKARITAETSQALIRLHQAITQTPRWRSRVRPGEELRGQTRLLSAAESRMSPEVAHALDSAAQSLDSLGEVEWFHQHGDFCLNNLLIGPASVAVIDFDEFGATSVPLHDEIGLGLSIYQLSAPTDDWGEAGRAVSAIADATLRRHPELRLHLPALFIHFLAWRINQGFGRATRRQARMKLLTMLAEFSRDARQFFPDAGAIVRERC